MATREQKEKNAEKVLTIILTRGPYLSDAADHAVNTALAARKEGYTVNLFMYLDGVWLSHLKYDKDFNNPGEWLSWCIRKGVNVAQCDSCSDARDLANGDIVEGSNVTAVYTTLTRMIAGSDRVITFNG